VGRVKAEMMEAEERGWYAPDTHVCADCVEDEFLKSLIENNCEQEECDYCGKTSDEAIAAPTEVIMGAVADAVYYYFNDPTSAGVPWDDGLPVVNSTDTADVLQSIGLMCADDLFRDITEAFTCSDWVESANGNWLSSHRHEELSSSWESFVQAVKHKTRYFFTSLRSDDPSEYSPAGLLEKIGELVDELSLTSRLPDRTRLYRVRLRSSDEIWEDIAREMGPPPPDKARAGRMNPAGISYLYLAQELETALSEVLSAPPCRASYAEFLACQELRVVDLCHLPDLPSVFDSSCRDAREGLIFIGDFVETISEPVRKDGGEHVDYVPSQVVSEYFAKVFRSSIGEEIHGIAYPSAVRPGGRNVVLFPPSREWEGFDSLVKYNSSELVDFGTWKDLSKAIKSGECK
jgi:RES domain-containing protein